MLDRYLDIRMRVPDAGQRLADKVRLLLERIELAAIFVEAVRCMQ